MFFQMFSVTSFALVVFPLVFADKPLRGLVIDSTVYSLPAGVTATKGATTRSDPCDSLETAYLQCFRSLTSADVDSCVDCVNDKWPRDEGFGVLCTDFHDFACNGPASCPSCGQCQDEISDWLVCLHDNGGCTPRPCPTTGPPPTTPPPTSDPGVCLGGSLNACIGMCLANCGT